MAAPQPIPAQQRLGFPTRVIINPVTDTVGTTPTLIFRNNPERIQWLAINMSGNKGYIGWSSDVSSTKGIPVSPYGGFVMCTLEEDGELTIYEVYAVLENAEGPWYFIEIERR